MGLAFFGLTLNEVPQARLNLFTQIHEICFHGQGGYDWHTIYNMPIWLRLFTFNKIREYYENQNEQVKQAQNPNKGTTLVDSTGKVDKEQFRKITNETLGAKTK